ncbi:MAG TPA: hypothetical protein VJL35_05450 [Gemmatimonadaceae bacterium]|nr:hypothetical protein [Gemmatimonadaceae bacterium]
MPVSDAVSFLLLRLTAAGVDKASAEPLLLSLASDIDGQRMAYCLAIDLATLAIDIASLVEVFPPKDTVPKSKREDLGVALNGRFGESYDEITTSNGVGVTPGEKLVSIMSIYKYLAVFKGASRGSMGPAAVASQVQRLKYFGGSDGLYEYSLVAKLRGAARPLTWVTEFANVDAVLGSSSPTEDKIVELIERLGLPWEPLVPTHTVILKYPSNCREVSRIGRPNSLAEDWNSPGLFVAGLGDTGWGLTCPRTDSRCKGIPELVHDTIGPLTFSNPVKVQYLGQVTLQPADPRIARDEAAMRWQSVFNAVAG